MAEPDDHDGGATSQEAPVSEALGLWVHGALEAHPQQVHRKARRQEAAGGRWQPGPLQARQQWHHGPSEEREDQHHQRAVDARWPGVARSLGPLDVEILRAEQPEGDPTSYEPDQQGDEGLAQETPEQQLQDPGQCRTQTTSHGIASLRMQTLASVSLEAAKESALDERNLPAADGLAAQALDNLVNQFARPLDFLRELVQNSIDAGTPRVEIWLRFVADDVSHGVLEIHVDDFGEGMDERIIDDHLTRLFSSTKEDDLTKIGKFGIGFTSIFAIQPDAVILKTSRHGESWELLFHPDRSFDKVRSEQLVDGTKITLFKRMPRAEVEGFVRDCRWILGWWCEHSDTPVTFWDRTGDDEVPAQGSGVDPFAAFAEGGARQRPEAINKPMDMVGATLKRRLSERGVEAVVAYQPSPRYGYYNGGLTLVNTRNRDVLGPLDERLAHLGFKLKTNTLEHTLTRDNVLQDEHWQKAMEVLLSASDLLRADLVERVEQALRAGEELSPWHGHLAQECGSALGPNALDAFRDRPLFRDTRGTSRTLEEIEDQEDDQGVVLMATASERLDDALASEGIFLVEDSPETRELLMAADRPPLFAFWSDGRSLRSADEIYVLPDLIRPDSLPPRERLLVNSTAALLKEALGRRVQLMVGALGGSQQARDQALAMEGPEDGRVFQRPEASWLRIPAFLRSRALLLNRHHPFFQLQCTAGAEDLDLASYALAQALLHEEDAELERSYRLLIEAAAGE